MASVIGTLLGMILQLTPTVDAQAATYYFHTDHLGTPQVVTNARQDVVWEGRQSPFGEMEETTALVEQNLRFPGQYLERETGLHQNWRRDYDPTIGRYIEPDPIGLAGGLNAYAYVNANPLVYVDETGEFGVVGALFGAAVEIGIQLAMNDGRLECVDWYDVAISGAVGAFAPGLASTGKTVWTSGKAISKLDRKYARATSASSRLKTQTRITRHRNAINDAVVVQGAWQGSKQVGKQIVDDGSGQCGC